jgi:hypothetical protein
VTCRHEKPSSYWQRRVFGEALGNAGAGLHYVARMARTSTHTIQAQQHFEARSSESFNRLEFAMRLLKFLKPQLNVAVYARARHLHVERGGIGLGAGWAMLGIPPHATRENIVRALVELAGVEHEPFLVDLLCGLR